MDAKEFFIKVVKQADGLMKTIGTDKLTNPTPCSEWDLKQLANHLINELLWVPELLGGKTINEVGDSLDGDLVGDDFAESWQRASRLACENVDNCDVSSTVHLSYGDFPAQHYIDEVASDVLIHSWDVGQSVQCSVIMEEDLAKRAYDKLLPSIQAYKDAGFVGEEVSVAADANTQTKLLAMVGRKGETVE